MNNLTKKQTAQLKKALSLLEKATQLIDSVHNSNDKLKYCPNSNILNSRLSGSISLVNNYLND